MFARTRASLLRAVGAAAVIAAIAVPLAMPTPTHAWVRFGFGFPAVGVYVAPPAYYAPPPVYYAPPPAAYYAPPAVAYAPGAVWVAPFFSGGYWHPGYWRR